MEMLYQDFEKSRQISIKELKFKLLKPLDLFINYYNIQQFYFFKAFNRVIDDDHFPSYLRAILQCILKSSHLIYTTNYLTLNGDYGAARILNRQTLEYLLVGKYISIEKDFAVKWLDAEDFKAAAYLFNRMLLPDPMNIKDFWNDLCKQAHAKTSSFQIGIMYNDQLEVKATFFINFMLLRCKENLVSIFIKELNEIMDCTNDLDNLSDDAKRSRKLIDSYFSETGIYFINDYTDNWKLKTPKNKKS